LLEHTVVDMLYVIGLGLADEKDISVKGLEIVKTASRVYLEAYTAILLVDKDALVGVSCLIRQSLLTCPRLRINHIWTFNR